MIVARSLESLYAKHKTKLRLLMALDKPPSHLQLEYGMTDSNGRNYNKFGKGTDIPVERMGKINEYQMWLSAGLTHTELQKFLDEMKSALADGLKKDDRNATRLGACIYRMEERKNMVVHTELFYNYVAVQLIREDEDPAIFNEAIHMEKIAQFKKEVQAGNSYDFFFKIGLSKLSSLQDFSPSEWNSHWDNCLKEEQLLEKEIAMIHSVKKSSPTGKVSGKKS